MRQPFALAIVLLFVATAPFLWLRNSQGSQQDQGKTLYDQKCAICHGQEGDGNGPAAASLTPQPTNFTKATFWQSSNIDRLITKTVLNGHGPMPPFQLNEAQLKSLIGYMKHSFKPGQ